MSKDLTESEIVNAIKEDIKTLPISDRVLLTLEFSLARNCTAMVTDLGDLLPMLTNEWMREQVKKRRERREQIQAEQEKAQVEEAQKRKVSALPKSKEVVTAV